MSVRAAVTTAFAALLLVFAPNAQAGSQVSAKHAALATASPYATQIGLGVLKKGGNAIDAAVAVSFALAVAQPQAGNLGGGGFLVYYDAATKAVWTLDYREVAPLAATRDMYAKNAAASRTGPLGAGVPGTVAGLAEMHRKFGTKPWAQLLEPAIQLAREGVRIDGDLGRAIVLEQQRKIDQFPSTAALFYRDGKPLTGGATLVQNDLAATLMRLALKGAGDFYEGDLANKFVDGVKSAGGVISYRDLREYKPVWRAPIKIAFRNYALYTVAPPSSGGLVIGETLNILGGFDLAASGFQTAKTLHLLAEAERRAYIDRNHYLADPTSARIPYRDLLSDDRAKLWRASIKPDRVTPTGTLTEPTSTTESNHTTHFTIVDEAGNIASVTTTLNDEFGSGFVVPGLGFFLNDAMDDFTTIAGQPNAQGLVQSNVNAIAPQKRPASSMAPTIIFRDDKPYLALGTPGGATIPTTILQVFLNVAVWRKPLYDAIAALRFHQQDIPEDLTYEQSAPQALLDALNAQGHGTRGGGTLGDVHAILIEPGKLTAVSDPRHGGAAGGY